MPRALPTIFVIDDEPSNLLLADRVLQHAGFAAPRCFDNPRTAIEAFRRAGLVANPNGEVLLPAELDARSGALETQRGIGIAVGAAGVVAMATGALWGVLAE